MFELDNNLPYIILGWANYGTLNAVFYHTLHFKLFLAL